MLGSPFASFADTECPFDGEGTVTSRLSARGVATSDAGAAPISTKPLGGHSERGVDATCKLGRDTSTVRAGVTGPDRTAALSAATSRARVSFASWVLAASSLRVWASRRAMAASRRAISVSWRARAASRRAVSVSRQAMAASRRAKSISRRAISIFR